MTVSLTFKAVKRNESHLEEKMSMEGQRSKHSWLMTQSMNGLIITRDNHNQIKRIITIRKSQTKYSLQKTWQEILDVDPRRDDEASPMSSYRCM